MLFRSNAKGWECWENLNMSAVSKSKSSLRKVMKEAVRKECIERKRKLISEVKKRSPLWDKKSPKYKDRALIQILWKEVAASMEWDVDTCKKVWKNMIDQFRTNYYDSVYSCQTLKNGLEATLKNVKWVYFKHLMFLRHIISRRTSFPLSHNNPAIETEGIYSEDASSQNTPCPSPAAEPSSPMPSPGTSTSASTCVESSDKTVHQNKKTENNSIKSDFMLHLINEVKSIKDQRSSSTNDTAEKFGEYVAHLLREVPAKDRRRCEMAVIQVVHSFLDDSATKIFLPVISDVT